LQVNNHHHHHQHYYKSTILSCHDDEFKSYYPELILERYGDPRGQSNLYLREQGELLFWALAINTFSRQTFK